MPSGTYGRGGGNFTKKPKPVVAQIDASVKSNSIKSNGKVSLLKKIALSLPGSQSKSSGTSSGANQSPRGTTRHTTNSRKSHSKSLSNKTSSPLPPVIRMPAINLNSITPGTSEDERSDRGHSRRPLPPKEPLPFSSRQPSTDNEGTAVNEPPTPEVSRIINVPVVSVPPGERVRFTPTNDRSRRQTMPPPPQPKRERPNQHDPKTMATLEGKPGGSTGVVHRNLHRVASNDNEPYKRARRTTLTPSTLSRSNTLRRPISEFSPFTDVLSLKLNEHTRRWSRNTTTTAIAATTMTTPPSDPFSNLFTSCVISLILLIILAAGKDILYVVALLPVIITLAKHFLDLDQLGLYTPLMRENLESLLSI